eukprot:364576-Chlamydomonas_euryale.AAC.3
MVLPDRILICGPCRRGDCGPDVCSNFAIPGAVAARLCGARTRAGADGSAAGSPPRSAIAEGSAEATGEASVRVCSRAVSLSDVRVHCMTGRMGNEAACRLAMHRTCMSVCRPITCT